VTTLAERLRDAASAIRLTAAEVSLVDGDTAVALAQLARTLVRRADEIERGQAGLGPLGLDDPADRLRPAPVDLAAIEREHQRRRGQS
jgi:hypothetical protein